MYNYFYTIEINMTSSLARKKFGKKISSIFKNISTVELTSRSFTSERDCVDEVKTELDKITKLVDEYDIEPLIVDSRPNPFLMYEENKIPYDVSEEEKKFWNYSKLALFAIFENKEDIDFFVRFVIYAYDDQIDLKNVDPMNFAFTEPQSKFLN